ncbi:UDP-glucuronic acid decarboxylase 1-like isoform X2 [Apostichopus japonicus]|uniref:UDP-glucuronic acid decarboxylase 1-like isoform X2 n=1 Tax=Stichopus japonicus TaxID=307972 RepID=UPI003AB6769A
MNVTSSAMALTVKRFRYVFIVSVILALILILFGRLGRGEDTVEQEERCYSAYHCRADTDNLNRMDSVINEVVIPLQKRIEELEKLSMKKFPEVRKLPEIERKRILITGGAGFVGSHLVDRLMEDGHEVTVVDNFFTGRKRNVEHWIGHPNFEMINHDVVNPLMIEDPQEHPQNEEYWGHVNPIGPRACYDEGKRVAETMCYAYAKQENVEVRVARIFNTFGPRMHMNDGRVVSNFIIQSLKGEPITIFGSGKQTRSFQYVSDLVAGMIALMNSNISSPVNLGNPEEHTIMDFANIIKEKIGGDSKITNIEAAEDDPKRRKPDIAKAKKHLKWEPIVPLSDGLEKTIDYFREEVKLLQNKR